jgi:hypothetical protein
VLRANVFQKLLVKYRTGKVQYQDLKRELEKLSGKLGSLRFEMLLLPFRFSFFHSQMPPRSSLRLSPSWPTRCWPTQLSRSNRSTRRSFKACGLRLPGLKSWKLSWRRLEGRSRRCG